MGRRRFLHTLSGLGILAGALQYMTQDALADITDNPRDEVPRLSVVRHTNHNEVVEHDAKPEREPVYYTIPRDEWEYVEGVFDGAKRIRERVERIGRTDNVRVGVTTDINGHHEERIVIVENQRPVTTSGKEIEPQISIEQLKESIPDTINGKATEDAGTISDIPIRIRETRIKKNDFYDYEYRPVPSGCRAGGCTIGYRVYHSGLDEWVQTTAGHCVDAESGIDVTQPSFSEDDIIGQSYDAVNTAYSTGFDAATIRMPNERVTPDFAANDGSYEGWSIWGYVGEDELRDNVGNSSYQIHKQGKTTGRPSGTVTAVYAYHDDFPPMHTATTEILVALTSN
jgi:hypothetical protein